MQPLLVLNNKQLGVTGLHKPDRLRQQRIKQLQLPQLTPTLVHVRAPAPHFHPILTQQPGPPIYRQQTKAVTLLPHSRQRRTARLPKTLMHNMPQKLTLLTQQLYPIIALEIEM